MAAVLQLSVGWDRLFSHELSHRQDSIPCGPTVDSFGFSETIFGGTAKTRSWVNLPFDLDSQDGPKY